MKQLAIMTCSLAMVFLILVAAASTTAYAGNENKTGTNAAPELLIPVGARDIAMGGSSIATSTGLEAIFWNPAGLARSEFNANAMFSHMNHIADIGVEYVAVSAAFEGFGTLGLSFKALSIGDINITTEDAPDGTGEIFSPSVINAGLTFSRLLTDRVSVGATATLISQRFDRVSATGFAFSAGVQYSGLAGFRGLSVGVAVKNIGPQLTFEGDGLLRSAQPLDVLRSSTPFQVQAASFELPSTIEIGVAYTIDVADQNVVNVATAFQSNNFGTDQYNFGAEYDYNDQFFLRGGYSLSESTTDDSVPLSDKTSFLYGFTAGAGVHTLVGEVDLRFDYAFRNVDFSEAFGDNHIFSVKLGF